MSPHLLNYDFYSNYYNDLKVLNMDEKQLHEHYYNYGINEKRVCCKEQLEECVNENLLLIKNQYETLKQMKFKQHECKLNILIRTSMRPEMFKACIESVFNQEYRNYHIYICYDSIECLEYLNEYDIKHDNITTFFVKSNSVEEYKFNLYNNMLMDKVNDGFIIFLDDDDVYTHNLCFKIINENITIDTDTIIWHFMKQDKIIKVKHISNIRWSEVDTTMVCFNNKFKKLSTWKPIKCGDYHFYKKLLYNLFRFKKSNIIKIDYILTRVFL